MKIVASGQSTFRTTMILLSCSMVLIFLSLHGVFGQPLMEDPFYQHPASETTSGGGVGTIYALCGSSDPKDRTYCLSHMNEIYPTKVGYKGDTTYDIPYDDNFVFTNTTFDDIVVNNYKFFEAPSLLDTKLDANDDIKSMKDMMEITSVDGIIVMKDGNILVEKYRNGFDAKTRHIAYSMTKSFAGVMVAIMLEDPTFDVSEEDLIIVHIPELDIDGGAFQHVTVREVLDMTAQFQWNESIGIGADDCIKRVAEMFYQNSSLPLVPVPIGVDFPTPEGCELMFDVESRTHMRSPEYWLNITNNSYPRYPGPQSSKDSLMNLKDDVNSDNGDTFVYRSANTMVLGWLIENLTDGKGMEWFSKNIWGQIGQNSDSLIQVDTQGFPFYGAGSMHTLMDAVRYGEMMRNDGMNYLGEQIVPKSVVDDIIAGGTEENIKQFTYGEEGCDNCLYTSSKDACVPELCGGSWENFTLPDNVPVMQYLNALNDGGNYSQGATTGGVYRNQYRVLPNHMFVQAGIHGQRVAVFPKIGLVIAMFSSQPTARALEPWVSDTNMAFTIAAEYANLETSTSTAITATSEIPDNTSEKSIDSSSSMIESLTMASSLFATITMTFMMILS